MVRSKKKDTARKGQKQGENQWFGRARKIKGSTRHGYTEELLSPYGGLLPLVKLWEALQFDSLFSQTYQEPRRSTAYGSLFFVKGLIMLLFIGFCRLNHFVYVSEDPMLLGILGVKQLPAVSTFWRYLQSVGHNQGQSLLRLNAALRERAWNSLNRVYHRVHIDIDTTVETVYGAIEGARKGHNTQHRGKKGLRPVLAFLSETREYLSGNFRRGETISGQEVARFILSFRPLLPGCVRQVIIRADAEFYSGTAIKACERRHYDYIISAKRTHPDFDSQGWYSLRRNSDIQYNSCWFQPIGWDHPCRFVVQRIFKEKMETSSNEVQCELFEDDRYRYRIFVTSLTAPAHKVIRRYDGRAGAENLVGEAKREGLAAIPTKKFQSNKAYFQIVMLSYNLWRYIVGFAQAKDREITHQPTIHVARLKLLFLASKIIRGGNRLKILYSSQFSGKDRLDLLIGNLDTLRGHPELLNRPQSWDYQCQPLMQKMFCTKKAA